MTDPPEGDEHLLVLRAQDGDVESFERLVDRHQGRLFRIAYMVVHDRQDAEDIVQESLILAWRRLHLLENPHAFRAWITQITSRTTTGVVRKAARRSTDTVEHDQFDEAAEPAVGGSTTHRLDPEGTAVVHAQIDALAAILQSVQEDQRTCWVLREIDGLSYRQIARITGVTESTVRGRIARTRAHIVDRLEEWR